jgi:hypothetical protein
MFTRTISIVIAMSFLTAACSGSSDDPEPDNTSVTSSAPAPTVAPDSTPTTELASTSTSTTEPENLTSEPAPSDEDAAAAAHTRWMTEANVVDELQEGDLDRYLSVVREVTTGALLARLEERPDRIASGAELIVSPGYLSNIVAVEVSGDVANIVDCSRDQSEGYNAAGELTTAADDFFKLRSTRLVRVDGVWLVAEFFTGGDDRCDLDDS